MSLTKKNKIKRKKNKNKNKTKKINSDKCKNFFNTYNTFEGKIEQAYGKLFSTKGFDLEKTINKEFKKPINTKTKNQ